jgi:hypothetical protein
MTPNAAISGRRRRESNVSFKDMLVVAELAIAHHEFACGSNSFHRCLCMPSFGRVQGLLQCPKSRKQMRR